MDNTIKRDWMEFGIIGVVVLTIIIIGVFFTTGYLNGKDNNQLAMGGTDVIATLKGSIYSRGEVMSVFGVCSDMRGNPLNATATFSARFPNGTQYILDDSMTSIGLGQYLWSGIMPAVGGTYFTEIECNFGGKSAKAYGEWQNPAWVERVSEILEITNRTEGLVTDLQGTVIGINSSIAQEFSDVSTQMTNYHLETMNTLQQVNQTMVQNFNETNSLVLEAIRVANNSVDRNDSLLYELIMMLIMGSGTPQTGAVTWDIYDTNPDTPLYYSYFDVYVRVKDEYNVTVASPTVSCVISGNMFATQYMTPEGDHFKSNIFIGSQEPLTLSTNCFRV